MKKLFLFTILSVFCLQTFAQTEEENPYPSYYNKKKGKMEILDYKNVISTDLPSIIGGEIPFIWDYIILNRFQTSLGLGVLAPYYLQTEILSSFSDQSFSNSSWGYSAYGAATVLLDFPISIYMSFYGHYRGYSSVDVLDTGIRSGYKFCLGTTKIAMDLGVYAGLFFQKSKDGYTQFIYNDDFFDNNSSNIVIGFTLRIGYIIN